MLLPKRQIFTVEKKSKFIIMHKNQNIKCKKIVFYCFNLVNTFLIMLDIDYYQIFKKASFALYFCKKKSKSKSHVPKPLM